MKQLQDQRGVALVFEIVLVAVVLGVIGLAVLASLNANKTAKNSISTTPSATQSSALTNNSGYLLVKELGLKIPLTSDILDLYYAYAAPSGNNFAQLQFDTTAISSAPGSSGCVISQEPLGSYTVYNSGQSNTGTADNEIGNLAVNVNGKYIYYRHAQAACGDTAVLNQKVTALIDSLYTAVQHATSGDADISAITNALHGYSKDRAQDVVSTITVIGANAKGGANAPGTPAGYDFIAHQTNGVWQVVFVNQDLPNKAIGEKYGLPARWYNATN